MSIPRKNLIGKKFGLLTVIAHAEVKNRNSYWSVECECGTTKNVRGSDLEKQNIKSCGCMRHVWLDEAQKKRDYGRKRSPYLATAWKVFRGTSPSYNDGDLTFDEFLALSQLPCFYCGEIASNKTNKFESAKKRGEGASSKAISEGTFIYNGLDRLHSDKPHNKNNVVPCCKHCNRAKLAMTPAKFKIWLKQTSAHHLYDVSSNELDEAIALWKAQKEKDSSYLESSSELALVS